MKQEEIVESLKLSLKLVASTFVVEEESYERALTEIDCLNLDKPAKVIKQHWDKSVPEDVVNKVEDFLKSDEYKQYMDAIESTHKVMKVELEPYMKMFDCSIEEGVLN